jgi:hypothetical protein
MQLVRRFGAPVCGALAIALAAVPSARAEDRVDTTTTWFQENRKGGLGGLSVIHPQFDVGTDFGEHVSVDVGYAADVVSGATAAVYSTDAVSTATEFDDVRHEGSFSIGFSGRRSSIGFSVGTATERDYTSLSFGVGGEIFLPGKNTQLAVSYTHNMDAVCDRDNAMIGVLERRALSGQDPCEKNVIFGEDTPGTTVWHDLTIDTVQGTITQNLSPTTVAQFSLFGQVLHGFQSNPYRRVRVGLTEPQEFVPDVRGRAAISARINRYLPKLRGAVHVSLRGYSDTWGVNSGTAELGYSQYFAQELLLRVRARVYQQTEAVFFKDAFFYEVESAAGTYFTGDRELAPIRNVIIGGKFSFLKDNERGKAIWGMFDSLQLNLKGDLLLLDELAADDTAANPVGIENQFLNSGQFLDGFVLQLGLLLRY